MAGDSLEEIMGERGSAAPSKDEGRAEREPVRDEHGRFASEKQPEEQAPAEAEQQPAAEQPDAGPEAPADGPAPQGSVPQKALHASRQAEREAREEAAAARREVAQLRAQMEGFVAGFGRQAPAQPEPPPRPMVPDPLADPEGFTKAVFEQAREAAASDARAHIHGSSLERAHRTHGETFERAWNAALQYARQNPAFDAQMKGTYDLGEAVVSWYNRQVALAEIGPDPAAYEAKIREKILAEQRGGTATPAPRATGGAAPGNGRMPSNFADGGGGGGGTRRGLDNPGAMSLNEIMGR